MNEVTSEVVISARGLMKTYNGPRHPVEAVRGIDLDVRRGEIFGLVGPDAAGKTTTIQMLCGILCPTGGAATVGGVDVVANPDALGGRIGYMSEGFTLYGSLSVRENLEFFADLYRIGREEREGRIQNLLGFARLEQAASRRAEHLSGGMKKKLALACALIYSPQVLFLDEPTTGVDPVSRGDFWLLLNVFLAQGITLFVSTPYMDEAERFHRVALIHQGEIVACDTPGALKSRLQGEMIDVRAEPQREAAARLRAHPRVSHVQIFGERVHLLLENPQADLPTVERDLKDCGIQLSDVRRSTPGLEEVFVVMLEGKNEAAQTADAGHAGNGTLSRPSSEEHRAPVTGRSSNPQARARSEPSSPDYAIRVANLTKTFGQFTAVDNLSFDVRQGEIFGFLGPNGSGKTTTIRMLCGLLPPTSGTATIAGLDILTQQRRIKPEIGYMSQKFSLYNDLAVEENLDFYAGVYGLSSDRLASRKRWALEMAGLKGLERTLTRRLSGGWKQRLALGCAILHEPRVLFLDEPTSGVDPISRRAFWDLIYELSGQGVTVLVTTHYMDEAEHCSNLGLIYNGRLIALGSPSSLRSGMRAGEMLEIACPDPVSAVPLIRSLDGVSSVGLYGNRVHALVEDRLRLAPDITNALTAAGHAPHRIEPIPFSLEDLFVVFIEMVNSSQN